MDDEKLACDELAYLLKDFPEIEVVASGANGLEAVELIRKLEPDLVFLDVQMPGLDGMGVVRRLRSGRWSCRMSSSSRHMTNMPWRRSGCRPWTTC